MIGDLSSRSSRAGETSLPAAATSPSAARAFVAKRLAEWGYESDDVLLAVSELVTNALLHARTAMTVHLADEGDGVVLLAVSDGSAAQPKGRRFTVESGTGRGLRLLDSLSLAWGVDTRDGGKSVWARIRTGDGTAAFGDFDADAVEAL